MEKLMKNLKGFVYAIFLFFFLTLLASLLVRMTPIPEAWSTYYVMAALCISCIFIGIYAGCYMKKRGIMYGALYSIVFILIILIINMMAFNTGIEGGLGLLKYFISILFGSIGGMIGVNMKI